MAIATMGPAYAFFGICCKFCVYTCSEDIRTTHVELLRRVSYLDHYYETLPTVNHHCTHQNSTTVVDTQVVVLLFAMLTVPA